MDHAEIVAEIKEQCHRRRLPCYDTQEVGWKADAAGWVDLVVLGRGAALFVEVKKQDSRLSKRQQQTADELAAAGLWWRCWRESHLTSGEIKRELDNLASEGRPRVIGPSFDPDGPGYEIEIAGRPRQAGRFT